MNYKDFSHNPTLLIGKKVLVGNILSKIERVTKTGFGVKGITGLFNLDNGWFKGGDNWNTKQAQLISDEKYNELAIKGKKAAEEKHLKGVISERLNSLSIDKLKAILNIINS